MAEKGTMTATFEPTLDVLKLLEGKPTEYVVVNPVTVEASFKDGRVVRYPQEMRERVVRCRDCRRSFEERGELWCRGIVGPPIEPEGFCAWGEEREA